VEPSNPQKLALTLLTSGGRSVSIVRSLTQTTESFFYDQKLQCIFGNFTLPNSVPDEVYSAAMSQHCVDVGNISGILKKGGVRTATPRFMHYLSQEKVIEGDNKYM
jgi:hypothetical protein